MSSVIAFAMLAALQTDVPQGQWQDFGTDAEGLAVSVNIDSVELAPEGARAIVRLRRPGATGRQVGQSDVQFSFDCSGRTAQRRVVAEQYANGEAAARADEGEPLPPVEIAAGTPLDEVRELACSIAG